MQPRHELKYYIALSDASVLAGKLARVLTPDPHAGPTGEYSIRSLYFDDAFDTAYRDKLDGVMHRDKYRIRIYNASDRAIFLERKRKVGDMIEKASVRITRRLCDQLTDGDPTGLQRLENPLIQDLFVQMRLRGLHPVVLVVYDREAYIHPVEHTRITFDKRISSGVSRLDLFDPELPTVPATDPGVLALEVKFDRYLPDFLPPLLSAVPSERSAISKYVLCRSMTL